MKKYFYLIFTLLLGVQAFAQGHFPGTVLPATPNTAPWNVYSAAPDQRQNASVTNAQSLALLPTGTGGTDIFAYYAVDTTGYTFYLVYTTNGTVPTKTNGTLVNMSFAAFSSPNRIWAGKIPQQTAGTVVNYVIYVNTTGGTLAAANNRIASSRLGIQSTWTEGDVYYSMIAPGGVTNGLTLWLDAQKESPGIKSSLTNYTDSGIAISKAGSGSARVVANKANFNNQISMSDLGNNYSDNSYFQSSSAILANNENTFAEFYAFGTPAFQSALDFNETVIYNSSDNSSHRIENIISSGSYAIFDNGYSGNLGFSASPFSPSTFILSSAHNGTVYKGYSNGLQQNNLTTTTGIRAGGNWRIGNDVIDSDTDWSGVNFNEAIVYSQALSDTEILKVHSYLAIKYGVTLNQSTLQNYLASDGTTVWWNATTNAAYSNNIAGIARDDASGLNQKQSQSINSGIQPVIGNGNIFDTNANNTNNFSADLSALVWGSDTGSTSFATSFVFGGLNNRLARIWRVQETGTVGTVKVAIPVSQITGSISQLNLVVSADATFDGSDSRTAMTLETLGGIQYYTATVDFTSGQFFSFAAFVTAPGGVLGSSLWLKADSGTSTTTNNAGISQWNDQGGNNATQGTVARQPLYRNNITDNINFNPVVYFTPSGTTFTGPFLNIPSSVMPTGNSNYSAFSAGKITGPVLQFGGSVSTNQSVNIGVAGSSAYNGGPNDSGATIAVNSGLPQVIGYFYDNSIGKNIRANNTLGTPSANTSLSITNNTHYVGRDHNDYTGTGGYFEEVIAYNKVLSSIEIQRIQSYLSIKTGVTLNQNYLMSDGATIAWNTTTNTGYNNNIAGIARDDASALNQKQSQSVNNVLQPVIGNVNITDTNANNTNNFSADLSALVWGSDTGSASFATSFAFGGLNNRLARIWKVQETGTVGNVKIAIPVSQLSGNVTQLNVIVSSDATFDGSDSRTAMTLETLGGVQYYTATIDFTSGQFFTFAALVAAPGGVVSGLNLWVKANAGFSPSQWLDQSGSGFVYQQLTSANQPTTGVMNFNPAVKFDGSNDFYQLTSVANLMNGSIDSNYTQIAALNSNTSSNTGISDIDSSCGANGDLIWQSNGTINIDRAPCGTGQPSFGGSAIVPNVSHLNTITYASPSGQVFTYRNNLQNGTATQTGVVTTISTALLGYGDLGSYYNGNIGEYIIYNKTVSNIERQRIDSYLAIKYGVTCLLYTSPSPRDRQKSRMPSSA
nr:hypothetical protein [uncultured Chryseobacterium sp.]